jgi:hypothetical protein
MNFSVQVFKKRLDDMLLKAGARAKHVRNLIFVFEVFAVVIIIFTYM